MKFRWDKKYLYWGITAFMVIAGSLCFYSVLFYWNDLKGLFFNLIRICMPIIDGLILAYLLTPVLNFIERTIINPVSRLMKIKNTAKNKRRIRLISCLLTVLLAGYVLFQFLAIVIPELLSSIQSIIQQFNGYVTNLTNWLEGILADNPDIENYVVVMLERYSQEINTWLNTKLLPLVNDIVMNSLLKNLSVSVIGILLALWNLIIGTILSIYLLSSKEKFAGQCKKIIYSMFDTQNANQFIDDVRFTHKTFGGFISGKILDSIIIGILCFICISFMDMPYPLLISVIIGVTNVIPFFGPYLGAIPSAILILMVDPRQCLYFIIFILILQQFDGNILGPKILGDSTGLSSFWVIFAITLFGGLFGIPGMIIGVPAFAVIYAMFGRRVMARLKKRGLPPETEPYISAGSIVNGEFVEYVPSNSKKKKKGGRSTVTKEESNRQGTSETVNESNESRADSGIHTDEVADENKTEYTDQTFR